MLWFDLANSPSLSEGDKALIANRLGSHIGKDGVLRVVSQSTRSQAVNRELAIERFTALLRAALHRLPIRKRTRVSKGAKERRLEEKKQRSGIKRERSKSRPVEEKAIETTGVAEQLRLHACAKKRDIPIPYICLLQNQDIDKILCISAP